jgi:hypothetical protein
LAHGFIDGFIVYCRSVDMGFLQIRGLKVTKLSELEAAYAVDLLTRLTESIETYLDDDRSGILEVLEMEIKEANRLTRKYWKRVRAEVEHERQEAIKDQWIRQTNKEIREGAV